MGWKIHPKTGDIICTAGDTPSFKVRIGTIDAESKKVVDYIPEETDSIYLNIKYGHKILLTIDIDKNNLMASFSQKDTGELALGEYKYDVVLEKENGYRCTFIADKKFIIT